MKTFRLRCVVLEDEDDIRLWMVEKLNEYPELDIVGEATNIDDAYRLIATTKPEVAFMDVQLIGGDAFTLLSRLRTNGLPIPYIVMATGYPEYVMTALNDYRQYVVQYLTKPFVENYKRKFRKAIDALMAATMNDSLGQEKGGIEMEVPKKEPDHIFLQNRGSLLRLDFEEMAYLEAAGKGESIVVLDKITHTVDLTLAKFMNLLPDNFHKISRSNVVNSKRVLSINRGERTLMVIRAPKNKELGISDHYYNDLLNKLPLAKDKLLDKSTEQKAKTNLFDPADSKKKQTSKQSDKVTLIKGKKREVISSNKSKKQGIVKINSLNKLGNDRCSPVTVLSISIQAILNKKATNATAGIKKEITNCFNHFDFILNNHNLKKYKITADSYLCLAISGSEPINHPKEVIKAALEIQQWMLDHKTEDKPTKQPVIELKIGIHSGGVILDKNENKKSKNKKYDALINLAHSVKQLGPPDAINISSSTWGLIRKEFNCRFIDSIETIDGQELEVYTVKK